MVHSTLVGSCSTVFWTHLSACHLYSWLLHSGFHCGIHSTAVPGFVDSIVMKFSLWGSLHSCLPACLPALGFVCCSAHSTAVCRKVHSAYSSHAVTPLFAPQLSAILYNCPLWDPILVCLLHSYIICLQSLPLSNYFVGLILYLVVFAPFEIIRSSQRLKLEAQSFFCRKQFS